MSYSTILVPVAPGAREDGEHAVFVARSLLSPGGRITVVTVLEDLPRYLTIEALAVDPMVEERNRAIGRSMAEHFTADDVEVLVGEGHPTRVILDTAKAGGHECIVIASAQPGWQSLLLGSTASGVVRHARCSVHVLRDRELVEDQPGDTQLSPA